MTRAFSWSCVMVFLRKVLIFFKVEKHLSDSAVVIGVVMRILKSERVWKVVLLEKPEQSRCTTAGLEVIVLVDEG